MSQFGAYQRGVSAGSIGAGKQRRREFVRREAEEPVDVRPGVHQRQVVESGVGVGPDPRQVAFRVRAVSEALGAHDNDTSA